MNIEHFRDLVTLIKTNLHSVSENEWHKILIENYQQFALMTPDQKWVNDLFEGHHEKLIPKDSLHIHLNEFLNLIEVSLLQNPYFIDLLTAIPYSSRNEYSPLVLTSKSKNTEAEFLKYLIAFAFCLEKINEQVLLDSDIQENIIQLYKINRRKNNFYRLSNILGIIKFHSIELPLVRFLKAKKVKKMSPDFEKYILSFNIFEASLVDLLTGFWNNALATIPLIIFSPNFKGWPQVWNMAFVSQFPQSPYLLAKLIIPSVSDYSERSGEYMHTRITALHLAMNYLDSAMNSPVINIDLRGLGPSSKKLTKLWGEVNKNCAEKYYEDVKKK
ncbi:MAG: hypothetical protein H7177_17960 [Rhizobacter sp.]|nr:hypothetical protein [Bacteriovorax sp.]